MFHSARLPVLFGLAACASLAQAQTLPPTSEVVKTLVGGWEISNAARDRKCAVTLTADPLAGGYKLDLDPACAAAFPFIKDVVVWAPTANSTLNLRDDKGAAQLEFTEVENGMYEAERRGEGLYFMQAQAAVTAVRTPEQMFGEWGFLREAGKPICIVTLSKIAASENNYKLAVKAGCEASIANAGLASWHMEGGELILTGRGGAWRFEEGDAVTWQRIPLSTDPLLLVRQ